MTTTFSLSRRPRSCSLLTSTTAALALAAGLSLLPAQPAHAWWSCPTDKPNFEQRSGNPSHVRCTSEAQYRALDECPNATAGGVTVGTGIRRDWQGGSTDKCVGFITAPRWWCSIPPATAAAAATCARCAPSPTPTAASSPVARRHRRAT